MKNIILYIMCVVILVVVVISVVQAQYLYTLLFAVCGFLVFRFAINNKFKK